MDSRKYFRQQSAMLKRARLLSQFLLLLAALSSIAAIVLPIMQKTAVDHTDEVVSSWQYFLLQLLKLDSSEITWLGISVVLLLWMAYTLRALVSIAETQCAESSE